MRAALLLVALTPALTGCGAVLQSVYGFDEEVPREATRTRVVRIEGLPPGAIVERRDAISTVRLADPRRDEVVYPVEETVSVPKSRWPLWLGTGVDVASLVGIFAATDWEDEGGSVLRAYSILYLVPAVIADAVFAMIYSFDDEETVQRFESQGPVVCTYVARANGQVQEVTIDAVWQDRVVFDFAPVFESGPEAGPGGPRLP